MTKKLQKNAAGASLKRRVRLREYRNDPDVEAGYDAGRNGPNTNNTHFSHFSTKEKMQRWQHGYEIGKASQPNQKLTDDG